jgi:hypothetical protein
MARTGGWFPITYTASMNLRELGGGDPPLNGE